MTTATKSAYPVPVDELMPQAREMTMELGQVPGRNQLMNELRIGAKKARRIIDLLEFEQRSQAPNPQGLRLVPPASPVDAETGTDEDGPSAVEFETKGEPESEPSPASPVEQGREVRTGDEDSSSGARSETESEPDTGLANPVEPAPIQRGGGALSAWPVLLLSLPAFVAIWSGWVGLGELTGFGIVHPLPGIADGFALNTAITLPIGMETYAAYALRVWLSGQVPSNALRFAKYSALGSLALGALGQIAFHLMKAAGMTAAPWPITALVACLPVAVLGMGAALAHLIRDNSSEVQR